MAGLALSAEPLTINAEIGPRPTAARRGFPNDPRTLLEPILAEIEGCPRRPPVIDRDGVTEVDALLDGAEMTTRSYQ